MSTPTWPIDLGNWIFARPWLGVVAAVTIVATVGGHGQLLTWRHQRFAAGARWVTIAAPAG
ncbi:hypothetical protein KBX53_30565, partial [Micromonospora sp. M51]|uniref:hypothetical protein n=1 Tax=Micromonospora sp. M51 TaxID=2824889 RepID=UPI001B3735DF